MAVLDFPSNPSVGQTYSNEGRDFQWDGTAWQPQAPAGGGSVTFATQGSANAGTSTTTVMSPATTHGVVEHLAHVASYVGFQFASGDGSSLGAGQCWINSAGTQFRARGHTDAEGQRILNQFLIDRVLHRGAHGREA